MKRTTTTFAAACLTLCSTWGLAYDAGWTGYRGDGSGVFAGNPPTAFNEKTGSNVLWKVPLPNWGQGCPAAAGGRVYLTCEGGWKEDFPQLLCFDADTGRELWRRELNHLSLVKATDEEKAQILKTWATVNERYRLLNRLFNEWHHATDKDAAIKAFNEQTGWTFGPPASGGYLESCKPTDRKAWGDLLKPLGKANLTLDSWYHNHGDGLSCIGQTFPTPVTDGQVVYAVTAFGGVFCFDRDGKDLWKAFEPGIGAGDYCTRGRSPVVRANLLITDVDGLVRVFDRKTGELKWKQPLDRTYGTIVTPAVITTGGQDVLLSGGRDDSSGKVALHAFMLTDGRKLTVGGWENCGATMVVKTNEPDVVFFTGGGEHGGWIKKGNGENPPPAAVRFTLNGDALNATVLWSGVNGKASGSHTKITYCDGKLYGGGFILDANDGSVLSGGEGRKGASSAIPPSQHLLLVAGGNIYGLDRSRVRLSPEESARFGRSGHGSGAVLTVHSLSDGKKIAESQLGIAPLEGDKCLQCASQNGYDHWGFSNSCTFSFDRDRIFIRSNDYLWCIAKK